MKCPVHPNYNYNLKKGTCSRAYRCEEYLNGSDKCPLPRIHGPKRTGVIRMATKKAKEKIRKKEGETGEQIKAEEQKTEISKDDQQILNIIAASKNPLGSREISDQLGIKDPEKGRAVVRNAAKRLEEAGKIKRVKEGRRYQYQAA